MRRLATAIPKIFAKKLKLISARNYLFGRIPFLMLIGISLLGLALINKEVSIEEHFSLAAIAQQPDDRSFYEISGHPVKLFIYSQVPLVNFNSIVERLIIGDEEKILSATPISEDFDDADAAVFFIKSWDTIKELPSQESMSGIYEIALSNLIPEAISSSFFVRVNGKPMMMMFYIAPYFLESGSECITGAIMADMQKKPFIKSKNKTSKIAFCKR